MNIQIHEKQVSEGFFPVSIEVINEAPFNKVIFIGNTGLELRVNEVEWTSHFNPNNLTRQPINLEEIKRNSYLYLIGIHRLMQYWGEDDNFRSKTNPKNIITRRIQCHQLQMSE